MTVTREVDGRLYVDWEHVQSMRSREHLRVIGDIARLRDDFGQSADGRMALDAARDVAEATLGLAWSVPQPDVTRALVKNDPMLKRLWTWLTVRFRVRRELKAYDARAAALVRTIEEDPAS